MVLPNPRLMPGKTKILIEHFSWTKRVEGILVAIKFTKNDYLELIVNGKILQENHEYERVIEDNQRGLLFTKPSTIKGWATLKVYK